MAIHKTALGAFNAVARDLDKVPNILAEEVINQAKPLTPVDTERLRNSYGIRRSSGLGRDAVGFNDAPYSLVIELGGRFIRPFAMVRQAVMKLPTDVSAIVRKRIL